VAGEGKSLPLISLLLAGGADPLRGDPHGATLMHAMMANAAW
jgi:hypothetical protein